MNIPFGKLQGRGGGLRFGLLEIQRGLDGFNPMVKGQAKE